MDLLGDVLTAVHLRGRLHFSDVVEAPWARHLESTEHTLQLHFVASGSAVLDVGDGPIANACCYIGDRARAHCTLDALAREAALSCTAFAFIFIA